MINDTIYDNYMKIVCDNCGFEAVDGEYDIYEGEMVDGGVTKKVRLRGDNPYRLNSAHVCDRFEYGYFKELKKE